MEKRLRRAVETMESMMLLGQLIQQQDHHLFLLIQSLQN